MHCNKFFFSPISQLKLLFVHFSKSFPLVSFSSFVSNSFDKLVTGLCVVRFILKSFSWLNDDIVHHSYDYWLLVWLLLFITRMITNQTLVADSVRLVARLKKKHRARGAAFLKVIQTGDVFVCPMIVTRESMRSDIQSWIVKSVNFSGTNE